ncbi:hypothetical protein HHI36_022181, partial [Cryptolaemus montrouzieri]
MSYQSVSVWLKEIRENAEYYEPLAIYTSEDLEQSRNDDVDIVLCNIMEDIVPKRLSGTYENIWDCPSGSCVLPVKFGELRCVSVIFGESVEELNLNPVIYERVESEVTEDVMIWKQELRFNCEEEESILESE